jgi:hypothetical protein
VPAEPSIFLPPILLPSFFRIVRHFDVRLRALSNWEKKEKWGPRITLIIADKNCTLFVFIRVHPRYPRLKFFSFRVWLRLEAALVNRDPEEIVETRELHGRHRRT